MTTSRQISTKKLILTGMFTAIISVLAQITIPIQPIPFSLSLLAIFLTGMLLEPKYSFLSTLAYILLGSFGLPVFAGLKGGLHVLTGMTGGFIMAYPIMAFITALSYQLSKKVKSSSHYSKKESPAKYTILYKISRIAILALGMIFALFICYFIGTLWFSYVSGSTIAYALTVCVFPFIAFDLLKIALAISFGLALRRVIDNPRIS